MYFTNITNEELAYFKDYLYVKNFTIKLSDVLHKTNNAYDNKLFKIEDVTSTIVKVYPMFNCKQITSSNPVDKVFENHLIIANITSNETYLTFISNEDEEINDYTAYGTYYSIGDTLTDNQFNSIISLLRQNVKHTDIFRLNSSVNGEYGKYEFDIADLPFLDTGILIDEDLLENGLKVKLTDNVFSNSLYTLKLKIIHYSDVNILDDVTPSDFKVIDTLEQELTPDTWVTVDLSEYEENYIISLNITVEITHTKPIITGSWINTLTVTADKDVFQTGDTCNITATALDMGSIGLANAPVTFKFYDSNDTLIDTKTGTTDTNGQCTVSYLGQGTGALNIQCNCMNVLETYSLLDCLFLDYAVTGKKNSNWTNYSNRLTVTTDSNGTLLESNTSSNGYYFLNNASFTYSEWILEFDVVNLPSTDLSIGIYIQDSNSSNTQINFNSTETGTTGHFKLENKNNQFKLYVDDALIKTVNHTTTVGNHEIGFRLNLYATDKGRFIKYKNLKLLPI